VVEEALVPAAEVDLAVVEVMAMVPDLVVTEVRVQEVGEQQDLEQ
jgi:hypothetical protein